MDTYDLATWLDEFVPLRDLDALPRVVSRAAARAGGATSDAIDYRCRAGRWSRLAPAVYLTEPAATEPDWLAAAALHGGPRAVMSGAAALRAYGLDLPAPRRYLVLVPLRSGVESWGRIQVRPTRRLPCAVSRPGPPLAPAERAVADHVRAVRQPDRVQAVVLAAVQRRLCTVEDLGRELECGARRGSKLFREALGDAAFGAWSVPEAKAGRLLRAAGFTDFLQNVAIRLPDGILYPDFVWPRLRAILEIDSNEHHLSAQDQTDTLERDHKLQRAGYVVMHVKPSQLRVEAAFVRLVREWLDAVTARTS